MVCLDDFEKYAFENIQRNALDYYRSGANNETTLKDNVDAFRRQVCDPLRSSGSGRERNLY